MTSAFKNRLLFLVILTYSFFSGSAYACECEIDVTFENALENATAVFIGRVSDKKLSGRRPNFSEVKFTVFPNRKFKGFDELPKTEFILVHTPADVEDCGINFTPGFEYLVFVTGNPAFLKTTSCDRTKVLEKAMEDQQKLLRKAGKK